MEELIATFHIDWKLLLAQLVNFSVVVFVLWRFALKPLSKMLAERTKTVEDSLKNAEAIAAQLSETKRTTSHELYDARRKASEIIERAKMEAEDKRKELLDKTQKEIAAIVADAKEHIRREKEGLLDHARADLAWLVALGISRVLGSGVAEKIDHQLVADAVKEIGKQK